MSTFSNRTPDYSSPSEAPCKLPNSEPKLVPKSLTERLTYALGPLAGAIVLDVADFATLGPIGLVLGVAVGAPIGWWLASLYGYGRSGQLMVALLAALYCTLPFTEVLPLATIVAAVARFYSEPATRV